MARTRPRKPSEPSPSVADSARKVSFQLSARVDSLVSTEAKRRKISRSRLVGEVLAEHYRGVRICWPGDPDAQEGSAA